MTAALFDIEPQHVHEVLRVGDDAEGLVGAAVLSLLTTNSVWSTQIVVSGSGAPRWVWNAGSMFPTAIAWSAVATKIAPVARTVCSRMASCAARVSVMTPGSGPSSRIEPASTKGIRWVTSACMIPLPDQARLDRRLDRARGAHLVDRAHVQAVTRRRRLAAVGHAERRAVDRRLDVVDRDGVARQHRLHVADRE